MNKTDEQQIMDTVLRAFSAMKQSGPPVVAAYLKTIPIPFLTALALQKLKSYSKNTSNEPVDDQQKMELSTQICQQVFNELIARVRKQHSSGDATRDGAELFYRRAVTHLSSERSTDAERLLKRCVEIEPTFIDGWELLSDVLEQNGKAEAAENARAKLAALKSEQSSSS